MYPFNNDFPERDADKNTSVYWGTYVPVDNRLDTEQIDSKWPLNNMFPP